MALNFCVIEFPGHVCVGEKCQARNRMVANLVEKQLVDNGLATGEEHFSIADHLGREFTRIDLGKEFLIMRMSTCLQTKPEGII